MVHLVVVVSLIDGLEAPRSDDLPSPATKKIIQRQAIFILLLVPTRRHGGLITFFCIHAHRTQHTAEVGPSTSISDITHRIYICYGENWTTNGAWYGRFDELNALSTNRFCE